MRRRWALVLLSAPALIALLEGIAWARVGGGHSFSGGHSSSGGGHSYSGGTGSAGYGSGYSGGGGSLSAYFLIDALMRLFGLLWALTLTHPLIGLPVDAFLFFIGWRVLKTWDHPGYDITNDSARSERVLRNGRAAGARARLEQMREKFDPNFSQIALMDFLHSLYSTIQHARGTRGRLPAYAGYLSPAAIQTLEALSDSLTDVQGVVVGGATLVDAGPVSAEQPCTISVEFETCYTEVSGGVPHNWYARETWQLSRKAGVLSREPDKIRQIACPACGAPASADARGACLSCGNVVRSGQFDWYVDSIHAKREARPPGLYSDSSEAGPSLPTLLDPHFSAEKAQLEARDPSFKWDTFNARAAFIFMQLQKAWTLRKWDEVRPFESDAVFETHSYWIQEYRRQHLVNVLKDIRIEQMVPAKIQQDLFYSAITLRMVASMIDCTQSEDGKLVGGNATRARPFTEYWTFIRGKSAQPPKPGAGPGSCPACGAPLKINMAGVCQYCQAKITSGNFDWVLSSIEQDETYIG